MANTNQQAPPEHTELFQYLRTLVDTAQSGRIAYPKFALVEAYWHIGRIVVEIEQAGQARADYGIHLIEALSYQLTSAFGKGFGLSNMWRFKQFFLAFPILAQNGRVLTNLRQHLRQELKWSHYRQLMVLKNLQERAFYLQQAADELWTAPLLQRLIRSRYYYQVALGEDSLVSKKSDHHSLHSPTYPIAALSVGSPRSRVALLKKILLEQYVGYAFVNQRQYLSVNGKDHWIELVFFHIILQRYVLLFLGEHNPVEVAGCQLLLDQYQTKQPPSVMTLPIGLLINNQGEAKPLTTRYETTLSPEDLAYLPRTIGSTAERL